MVIGYHGKVNQKNGSDGTFLLADNSFQKDYVEMLSDLIKSVNRVLVGLLVLRQILSIHKRKMPM